MAAQSRWIPVTHLAQILSDVLVFKQPVDLVYEGVAHDVSHCTDERDHQEHVGDPCLVLSKGEADPESCHEDYKGQSEEHPFQRLSEPVGVSFRVCRAGAMERLLTTVSVGVSMVTNWRIGVSAFAGSCCSLMHGIAIHIC